MSEYFPKPYNHFGVNVKAELNLSNYATKSDLKSATDVDTSNLEAKSDLAEVDKIDVDKLKIVRADFTKLT